MRDYALVLLVTAAVTYLLTPLVRRGAVATHAMHAPRPRDTHTKPTPLLGGVAMYGGLVAGLFLASRLTFLQDPFQSAGSKTAAGLLLAGGLAVVVGFIDDRWGLGAVSKLAAQVAAAGILVWSGQSLPWLPTPGGGVFSLEPDLSLTLTILIVVITINAINFIDGLDGLAAGIVAVAALSFLIYSYTLIHTIGTTSQSLPAVSSALLAGMCIGFLPHNFYPARIFMGDSGAMLLGLLLAYGPISSTASLDPGLLINYSAHNTLDRYPTFLPLLVPAAIFIIPYADLMFAVIRRTKAGKPLMAADQQHLHHRVLNIGHSYRQSVLIMYLWAALFSVTVVSLSVIRTKSPILAAATVVAVLTLLPVTMPRLRPWRARGRRRAKPMIASPVAPDTRRPPQATPPWPTPPSARPSQPAANGTPFPDPAPFAGAPPFREPGPYLDAAQFPGTAPYPVADLYPETGMSPAAPPTPFAAATPFGDPAATPFRGTGPFPAAAPSPGAAPFGDAAPFRGTGPFPAAAPFPDAAPFGDAAPFRGTGPFPAAAPSPGAAPFGDAVPFAGSAQFTDTVRPLGGPYRSADAAPLNADSLPRAGRLLGLDGTQEAHGVQGVPEAYDAQQAYGVQDVPGSNSAQPFPGAVQPPDNGSDPFPGS
jgi:UDP-GlcNAc:undecaprenyl-phosphate GlcNAc-1-phosphate transferase